MKSPYGMEGESVLYTPESLLAIVHSVVLFQHADDAIWHKADDLQTVYLQAQLVLIHAATVGDNRNYTVIRDFLGVCKSEAERLHEKHKEDGKKGRVETSKEFEEGYRLFLSFVKSIKFGKRVRSMDPFRQGLN